MVKREAWSDVEIAATVADYMKMLSLELAGQTYNKTAHRKALLKILKDRSEAAIELKHQNISAVLRDLECVWIPGYKPRRNYQTALANFVENWIDSNPEFDQVSKTAVEQPAFVPSEIDFSNFVVNAPRFSESLREDQKQYVSPRKAVKRDYLAREARNTTLGNAGELLALQYEKFRLYAAGKQRLAERVEHVSVTQGDGLGFDILSFDVTGDERFIEVKTTAFAKETPFFATKNEVDFSQEVSGQFHLYRLFEFRKSPKLFAINGGIDSYCLLEPVNYICHFR